MIFNETNNVFTGVTLASAASSGPVTVTQDGVVYNFANGAVGLIAEGMGYTMSVNGEIAAMYDFSTGMAFETGDFSGAASTLTVGTTGKIQGSYAGITSVYAVNITNKGSIGSSGDYGIYQDTGFGDYFIKNTGTIYADGITSAFTAFPSTAIVTEGTGKHTITNSGLISATAAFDDVAGAIMGSPGAGGIELVTNSGHIESNVMLFGNDDSLKNTGSIHGTVDMGIGVDKITNSGIIEGLVFLGDGADLFTNTGTVTDRISLGTGDDKFSGGGRAETVEDGGGMDKYVMGDGIDRFVAVGSEIGDTAIDQVDGGANAGINLAKGIYGDIYDAADSSNFTFINLTGAVATEVINLDSIAAFTAIGTDIGQDTVKNFEEVHGGTGTDIVFGTAVANRFLGSWGDDYLYGGDGNDLLDGGVGVDSIFGDGGGDKLYGGAADGNADTFYYRALTDSKVSVAARDTIYNFEDGVDKISFSMMGLAVDHWMNSGSLTGVNEAFDGLAGSVRAIMTATGWTLQMDVDGNKKVDMAIDVYDVIHEIFWEATDFVF